MVATTFSTDTPNLVTNMIREKGVGNNWLWWSFPLTGIMTVFFCARMWRRSGVLTDLLVASAAARLVSHSWMNLSFSNGSLTLV